MPFACPGKRSSVRMLAVARRSLEVSEHPMARPATSVNGPATDQPDPFRFGWRYRRGPAANGNTEDDRIPLTPEDVLHPQEYDQIPENTMQNRERDYLAHVLRVRLTDRKDMLVLSDCIVDWGVRGLRNHSPDVCIMEGVQNPEREWTTFHVVAEGARPVLVIEIVSVHDDAPQIRDNDVKIKRSQYYRVGVPLYVIVDQEREGGPRQLVGYRRDKRQYKPIPLDRDGRLLLEPVGILLGIRDNRVVCYDAATEEEIFDYEEMDQARRQAEEGRAAEALARRQAEEGRAAEALARRQAEEGRAAEAQARRQAEEGRAAEALARRQAEEALAAAQARVQELESQAQGRRRSPRKRAP
jgi:Uma2 family endonuclease